LKNIIALIAARRMALTDSSLDHAGRLAGTEEAVVGSAAYPDCFL
jgi:hypothetical protein